MSISVNRVIIAGNLTRDIEPKYLPSGDAVAEISVAINSKWKDKESGETKEKCDFVDCRIFGAQAENAAKYLDKGSPVLVEGRLRQDTWEDKETGKNRSKLIVICDRVVFLSGKDKDEDGGEEAEEPRKPAKPAAKKPAGKKQRRLDDNDVWS